MAGDQFTPDGSQFIQLPSDGTGKKIRVFPVTVPNQDATYLLYVLGTEEQQAVTLVQSDGRELQLGKLEGLLESILEELQEIHVQLRGY